MRVRLVLLSLLCCALCLCGISPLRAAPWRAARVPGATIFVHAGETALARKLSGMARVKIPELARIIGVPAPGPFPIYAYSSWPDFLTATGDNPDLLGESMAPSGTILLYVTGDDYSVQTTLAHELTHSLLCQRLGRHLGNLPTWVNEGLACHLSDPLTPAALPGVSRQPHHDGLLSLEQLEGAFAAPGSHDVAYWQSRSMVAWLAYHYPGALRRLIDNLADGETFESALYYATGLTPDGWWNGWQGGIPAYVYWLTLLSPQAVFTLMAVLVLVAALLRALRKRREAADDEDADDDPPAPTAGIAAPPEPPEAARADTGHYHEELLEDS